MAEPGEGLLTAEAETDNQTQTTQNWYPDEYKDVVAQKGWKDTGDSLKSYVELEKNAGGKIRVPTDASSAEEISAFYEKLGRPPNPDGYDIEVPEGTPRDEAIETAMKAAAYESGINKTAFESLVRKYYTEMTDSVNRSREDGETALKGEWKEKYETNLEIARRACRELGNEEFTSLLDNSGLGSHPVFVKTFFSIGQKILNDTLIKGDTVGEKKDEYRPSHINSPDMYATGDDDESKKSREYFKAHGHKY